MKSHTILVFHAGIALTQIEEFTSVFRRPVIAFSTVDGDGGRGRAAFDANELDSEERDFIASSICDSYRMVASPVQTTRASKLVLVPEVNPFQNDWND
jgi:hypothetical protein